MKTLKENAASVAIAIICAVLVLPSLFISCTNGEEFELTTRPLPPVEIRDTAYIWRDTIIYVDRVEIQGLKADGNPSLNKIDEIKYYTDYPIIEDGNKDIIGTNLKVWAKVGEKKNIVVISERNIGRPSFSVGDRSVKQYQDGNFNKVSFEADGVYTWEKANNFFQTITTMHELAWYKRFLQMLSSTWYVQFKEIRQQTVGKDYTMEIGGEAVEGTLYVDTLLWTASYYKDDVRTLKQTQEFFLAKTVVEPDPEAEKLYGENFKFKTISDNLAETSFELWQKLNNGKTEMLKELSATLKFWLVNANGVVVDLNANQEFSLNDLQAVDGSKTKVGEPRIVNGISIQEFVTTYTTKTDKSQSVFYGHTEEAVFLTPDAKLSKDINFLSKDFTFKDMGTSKLVSISDEGNFERMKSLTTIVATYFDRELTGEGIIILRKAKSEEPQPKPEKNIDRVTEKSFDGDKTYVITRFYDDGTYSDTTVVNNYGYASKIIMPTLERIIPRDNTNFGNPTIAKKGAASKIGSSSQKEGLIFQGMSQNMNSVYSGHSHVIELQYTALQYTEGGKTCNLSVPMWNLTHKENQIGTVRQEVENNRNYDVTPVSFRYNGAFGKGTSSVYNTDTEVWNDKGEISTITGYIGKNFGFDYVNATTSFTYATFYSIMSDGSEKELGKDGVNVYNSIEVPSAQIINAENFDITEYQPVLGSKSFVSQREVNGKFGGKFVVKKYRTSYTTKTNKAEVVFVLFHEEAEYVPSIGNGFPMDYREYEVSDLGITALTDLGRVNGRDGKKYDSQISASYNGRTGGILKAEVQLWVKTANKYGIDTNLANVGMTHTFDYARNHHIATVVRYENSDGTGGLKGFIDGKEVVKATWDEVNKPTSQVSLAQNGGAWVLCTVAETSDKNSYAWRSLMKSNSGAGITSIDKRHMLVLGYQEIYIPSAATENADGTVTITSAAGSVNVGAW